MTNSNNSRAASSTDTDTDTDAISLLKADHEKVNELFAEYEKRQHQE